MEFAEIIALRTYNFFVQIVIHNKVLMVGVTRVRLFKAKEVLRMLEAMVKRTIHYLQNLERTIILAVTLN